MLWLTLAHFIGPRSQCLEKSNGVRGCGDMKIEKYYEALHCEEWMRWIRGDPVCGGSDTDIYLGHHMHYWGVGGFMALQFSNAMIPFVLLFVVHV